MRRAFAAVLVVTGCTGDEDGDPAGLLDTGWFTDENPGCPVVQATAPEDGAADWYWRDPIALWVSHADASYEVELITEGGREVPVTVTPDATGLRLDVTFEGGLAPATTHHLRVGDCRGVRELTFTTSAFGLPLEDGPDTVAGRAWQLDIVRGRWLEPSGAGAVLGSLFGPVLVGVRHADAERIHVIGGLGRVDDGVLEQDPRLPTWNFPLGDFSQAPWFVATADHIEAAILEYPLPLHDVRLEGTFSADGRRVGGAVLQATGDTRHAAPAIGEQDPGAICAFATSLGASCIPCDDGEPYCLHIDVRGTEGVWVEGLRLVPQ